MTLTENVAVGLGVDVHRLEPGRPLVLGGVAIPFEKGLVAHSDGDVVLHAIMDAVLSAAGLEDLGTIFPDTDDENAGRSSLEMAREVARRIHVQGARLLSVDAVVICDAPRIAPRREQMRAAIAEALDVSPGRVNVKGKTSEGLGPLGRGEGIEARAVALVERSVGAV